MQKTTSAYNKRHTLLQVKMEHSSQDSHALDDALEDAKTTIANMEERIEDLEKEVAEKEEEIDNLNQKMSLIHQGNTESIIHNANNGLGHMADNHTINVNAGDLSALMGAAGLSQQQSLRALQGQSSFRALLMGSPHGKITRNDLFNGPPDGPVMAQRDSATF